jgi:hypothetical protein
MTGNSIFGSGQQYPAQGAYGSMSGQSSAANNSSAAAMNAMQNAAAQQFTGAMSIDTSGSLGIGTIASNTIISSGLSGIYKSGDKTKLTISISQIVNGYLIDYNMPNYEQKQIFCKDLTDVATQIVGVYAARQLED